MAHAYRLLAEPSKHLLTVCYNQVTESTTRTKGIATLCQISQLKNGLVQIS